MIDVSQDIQSMTTFKRNSAGLVKRMRKSGRPLVLTVKGKAEVVVMDAGTYQQLADRIDTVEGIRRGLAQAKRGQGRSVDEVFDDFEQRV
ncbi:MAG TPA: type II toxin-antitoxin system Phd/YefM family antitoxin [Bryobacteraceae bacterium]|jgi:prevent-host-death family protein|nr:type II toxin-antitoxin system Phd/YefM family antitoxin [Bryobacteraceae bacterium]